MKLVGTENYSYQPVNAKAAGLQAGDVITDVDGTPVSQIEDYREILSQMSGASSVSVSLERDGQPMNITITMD